MNVVLGIICENAIYTAGKNIESMNSLVHMHRQSVVNGISAIFEAADTDGSGELSRMEFDEAMSKKSVRMEFDEAMSKKSVGAALGA